jgi:hypothetical protein
MSPELREAMERHLEGLKGLPTVEIVEAICEEPVAVSQQEAVLKYFLVESPLRAKDLGSLLCRAISPGRAVQLCHKAARMRERHFRHGRMPRWGVARQS